MADADSSGAAAGPPEPMNRLGEDMSAAVRQQLAHTVDEGRAAMREVGAGAVLLAAAGLCGVLAMASGWVAALRILEAATGRRRAAVALTAACAAGAGTLAVAARARLIEARHQSGELAEHVRDQVPAAVRSGTPPPPPSPPSPQR